MLLDFNTMKEVTIPGMNEGTGTMSARMYVDEDNRLIYTILHPHSSIGLHEQAHSSDINFILSGHGKAICDDEVEELKPGTCHYVRSGQKHSIINESDEDLVFFTVVPQVNKAE